MPASTSLRTEADSSSVKRCPGVRERVSCGEAAAADDVETEGGAGAAVEQ